MNKTSVSPSNILLAPPVPNTDIQTRDWFSLPNSDPITNYMIVNLWDLPEQPESWQAVRLSPAAYIYREQTTGWAIVAKFHTAKTGADAERHAAREYQYVRQAWEVEIAEIDMRAVRPLGQWRGAIFLEYVDGVTLEDKIAIRRSQPGELSRILENVGRFLASFHAGSFQHETRHDFGQAADYAYKLVDNLARHSVIQNNPIVQNGFGCVIENWTANPIMWDFELTQTHGDATTTNFIFPQDGGGVAIDWERSKYDDPAADLGRLIAEIMHSIDRYGGNAAEALFLTKHLADTYINACPPIGTPKLCCAVRSFTRPQARCGLPVMAGYLARIVYLWSCRLWLYSHYDGDQTDISMRFILKTKRCQLWFQTQINN